MQVTAVRPRRHGLALLVIDDEPAMALDAGILSREGVRPGSELTDDELFRLRQESDRFRAKEKALYLLEHRAHFKGELQEKLRRDFSPEIAQYAADRVEELGLLDDEACGRQLAEQLLGRRGFSVSRARFELCRRGLAPELAEQIAEELAPPAQDTILRIIEKKYPLAATDEKQRRRAVNALQRMGYRLPEIRQALRCLNEMTDEITQDTTDETIELDEE